MSDPQKVIQCLSQEVRRKGGIIILNSKILGHQPLSIEGYKIEYRHLINCAGAFASEIARSYGFGKNYSMMPFLGRYKIYDSKNHGIKRLIYPVPNPNYPFLGVHFTLTTDLDLKIGPTAIPVIGKEQYFLKSCISPSDFFEFSRNLVRITKGKNRLNEIIKRELPMFNGKALINRANSLLDLKIQNGNWKNKKPGIRSQLIDIDSGSFVTDFIIEGDKNSTHILNAVSPGWTAALSFGAYVSRVVESRL